MKRRIANTLFICVLSSAITVLTQPSTAHADNSPGKPSSTSCLLAGTKINLPSSQANKIVDACRAGSTVYYPSFIPARFALQKVNLTQDDGSDQVDYELIFSNDKKLNFSIESASSGIGDGPDGNRSVTSTSKLFGPFVIDVFKPGAEGNCTKNTYYLSHWMTELKRKSTSVQTYYHFMGQGITDKEAVAIVESLKPITLSH